MKCWRPAQIFRNVPIFCPLEKAGQEKAAPSPSGTGRRAERAGSDDYVEKTPIATRCAARRAFPSTRSTFSGLLRRLAKLRSSGCFLHPNQSTRWRSSGRWSISEQTLGDRGIFQSVENWVRLRVRRQLCSFKALVRALGLFVPMAWTLLALRTLGREMGNRPATDIFSVEPIKEVAQRPPHEQETKTSRSKSSHSPRNARHRRPRWPYQKQRRPRMGMSSDEAYGASQELKRLEFGSEK